MGRKPLNESVTENEDMNAMVAMAEQQRESELTVKEINELYSDGKPYDVFRIQDEIQFYQDKAGEALIEIGKRFILIKANEEHGGFLKALENTGMTSRSAQFAMNAARKFSNTKSISHLGKTKMIALSVLDDSDIKEIEDLKEYAGHSIDELDQMSTRDLKELVKKERAEKQEIKDAEKKRIEALEKVVANKEAKITELELENAHRVPPTKAELAEAQLKRETQGYLATLAGVLGNTTDLIGRLERVQRIEGITIDQLTDWVSGFNDLYSSFTDAVEELSQVVEYIRPIKDEE